MLNTKAYLYSNFFFLIKNNFLIEKKNNNSIKQMHYTGNAYST